MHAAGNKTDLVFDDGTFVGVYLAADFTSEHEWGIKRLRQNLGTDRQPHEFGIEFRRATGVANQNIMLDKRKSAGVMQAVLYSDSSYAMQRFREDHLGKPKTPIKDCARRLDCPVYREDKICGAWDGESFAVYAPNAETAAHLETMYQAFLDGDAVIMMGGGDAGPFQNPGLALGIISRIPEDIKQAMFDADKRHYELKQAAEATGIYKLIERSNYFALSPHWYEPEDGFPSKGRDTEHNVIFWLNPYNQEVNAAGYFTVEQLTAWIKGEAPDGPISNRGNIYRRKQRAKRIADGKINELFSDEVFCKPCLNIISVSGFMTKAQCGECGNEENLIKTKPIRL